MSRAAVFFFPDDVLAQVLSLLDVKSLMQLKCVCKSWNRLISHPTFIKLHLNRSPRNPHIAIMHSDYHYSITTLPVCSLFKNDSITLSQNPNPYFDNNEGDLYLVGSCNGLLCFVSYFYTSMEWTTIEVLLYLWNPATRRISNRIVFLPDEDDELELTDWYFMFGYDNSTNTYKIVAVCGYKVRIFNVGEDNNVWRNIQNFPVVPLDNSRLFSVYNLSINSGVYVSGTINWFTMRSEHHQCVITSLDLSMEEYRLLKPPSDYDRAPNLAPILAVLMDSLCFSDYFKGTIIIWQMKEYGVEDSWTQILKFSFQNLPIGDQVLFPLCLSENDDILILSLPWFDDEDQPTFLYNFRDNRVEHKTRITNPRRWCFAKGYVESLVSTS